MQEIVMVFLAYDILYFITTVSGFAARKLRYAHRLAQVKMCDIVG
jgi:hypothetical protein